MSNKIEPNAVSLVCAYQEEFNRRAKHVTPAMRALLQFGECDGCGSRIVFTSEAWEKLSAAAKAGERQAVRICEECSREWTFKGAQWIPATLATEFGKEARKEINERN